MTWVLPECPYGVISKYIVFYRQSDIAQTTDIISEGFTRVDVLPVAMQIMQEYTINGLIPYKNYTIHVQTVVREGAELFGVIEVEMRVRALSDVAESPSIGISVTMPPTSSTIDIIIGDPTTIDTGRVM